jgi:7,8-dihydroneopterin aldolase/epimerase/oxygenase
MLGTIGFKNYRVRCMIGSEPYERCAEQEIFIDLKVEIDISRVTSSDRLQDTVSYVELSEVCKHLAVKGQYFMIETYAFEVTEKLFSLFPVKFVWIAVKKPSAIPDAEYTFVELQRENKR